MQGATAAGSAHVPKDSAAAIRVAGWICLAAAVLRGGSYLLVWMELSGPGGHAAVKGYQDTDAFTYLFVILLGFSGVRAIVSQSKQSRSGLVIWGIAGAGWSVYETVQIISAGAEATRQYPGLVFQGGIGLWIYVASGVVALLAGIVAFRARGVGAPLKWSTPVVKDGASAGPLAPAGEGHPKDRDINVMWLYVLLAGFAGLLILSGLTEDAPVLVIAGSAGVLAIAAVWASKRMKDR